MTRRPQSPCLAAQLRFLFALLALFSTVIHAAQDFYKLLGLKRSATPKEIKKAYRSKSLEFHPDKNKAEGAAEKFAEIAYAYEVLTDEEKKQIYDRHGEEGLKQHEQQQGQGGHGHGGFDDIFSHFGFGGFGGGGRQRQQREQTTPNVDMPLRVTLQQLYVGDVVEVEYVRQVLCVHWQECMKNNQECQGPGVKVRMQQIAPGFVQQVQQRDERCVAQGKMWRSNCKECPGQTHTEKIELTLDIQKGMGDGEPITFEGVADEKPGMQPGDLNFVIRQEKHAYFNRDGDHLYVTMEIPLVDALTGFSHEFTHLDGHKFSVNVDGVTECDHVMRVSGKGMPRRGRRGGFGDLYITFDVDFPDALTAEQRKGIRQILGGGSSKKDEL